MGSSKILAAVLLGLLSSIWRQYCSEDSPSTIQEESWIGWLSWALLYLGCLCSSYARQPPAPPSNAARGPNEGLRSKPWTVAGLSTAAIIAQLSRSRGIFPPANPIVTLATFLTAVAAPASQDARHLPEAGQVPSDRDFQEPSSLDGPITSLRVPFRIPVNLLLLLLLAGSGSYLNPPPPVAAAISLLFVVAQTIVFTSLSRLSHRSQSKFPAIHALLDWDLLERLSLSSIACFTCLLIYSISPSASASSLPNLLTFSRAITESASWISLFILCSEKLSTTATTFETVSTSFDVVTRNAGGLKLLSASAACIVALWQSVTGIPPSRKSRNWLYLLISIPLLRLDHRKVYHSVGSKQLEITMSVYPVESIVRYARKEFADLLDAQSKTVEEARREYTKRYGREPPPNFEKWFDLAMQHDFVLVDEFDSVMPASGDYVEAEDPEWGDKTSRLYWVGAATGGHTTEVNWKQMQRQRMALMTQVESTAPIRLLRESPDGGWKPYTSNMSEVSSLFSTRVVGVAGQCESAACEAQKQAFGIGGQEVKDQASAAYTHKFALDLDGNSFSGRFYRLLHSKSMVIKPTVFEEWHDDRLIPWIHYSR